ncbi:hypothetical protein B0H11DRAFT_2004715 [Mycena galericulata]|nr:hypothetical protein B0H11DRAFT_2004715 [Mycena galericulata]
MEPDLVSLIHSNKPPNESQTRSIQVMLGNAQIELSTTEESILKVSLVLAELERQKRRQKEFMLAMKAALSPIRRIPPELLAEVFILCRDNSLNSDSYSISDVRQAPMLLGHISSSWRSVCYGTPRLWEHVHLKSVAAFCRPSFPSFIDQILVRSGGLPIHVHLAAHTVSTWPVLRRLFRHHARLETIKLEIASTDVGPHESMNKRMFPMLTSVEIDVRDAEGVDPGVAAMLSVFNDAPLLRTVTFSADCPSAQSLLPALAWSQFTTLDLKIEIRLSEAREILTQCQKLQTVSLSTFPDAGETQVALQTTQLPDLRDLEIWIENDHASLPPDRFFDAFAFPSLKYLFINSMAWSPLTLIRLYERSQFRLEDLVLHFLDLDAGELIQFLAHLPLLQTLYLKACAVTNELYRAFTYELGLIQPLTLPHLRDVVLLGYPGDAEPGTSIANMAESIAGHSGQLNAAFPRLRDFQVVLSGPPFDSEIESRLAAAGSSGVFSYSSI